MVWGCEDRTLCNVEIQGVWIEQMLKFKYLGYMIIDRDKKGECENKVMNVRRVGGAIKELVNKKGVSL